MKKNNMMSNFYCFFSCSIHPTNTLRAVQTRCGRNSYKFIANLSNRFFVLLLCSWLIYIFVCTQTPHTYIFCFLFSHWITYIFVLLFDAFVWFCGIKNSCSMWNRKLTFDFEKKTTENAILFVFCCEKHWIPNGGVIEVQMRWESGLRDLFFASHMAGIENRTHKWIVSTQASTIMKGGGE